MKSIGFKCGLWILKNNLTFFFSLRFLTIIINHIIGILNNKMDNFVMWSAHLNIMKQITQTNYNKIKLIYHLRILKQLQKKTIVFFFFYLCQSHCNCVFLLKKNCIWMEYSNSWAMKYI